MAINWNYLFVKKFSNMKSCNTNYSDKINIKYIKDKKKFIKEKTYYNTIVPM